MTGSVSPSSSSGRRAFPPSGSSPLLAEVGKPEPESSSSKSSMYTRKKPGNSSVWPVARKVKPSTSTSAEVMSYFASAIWQATARFQIIEYSLNWSALRYLRILSGVLRIEVGRIASWASWAFLLLVL